MLAFSENLTNPSIDQAVNIDFPFKKASFLYGRLFFQSALQIFCKAKSKSNQPYKFIAYDVTERGFAAS